MRMKKKTPSLVPLRTELHRGFKELFPVAHGTLSLVRKPCNNPNCRLCASGERHPAWTFVFRKDGKARCMHVQPRHVEIVRKAVENGRRLEEMILDGGIALLERLREQE